MKKLSKITICLFMILSFLFVGNVKADKATVDANGIPGVGGVDDCKSTSYVCIYNLAAIRVSYYDGDDFIAGRDMYDSDAYASGDIEKLKKGTYFETNKKGVLVGNPNEFSLETNFDDKQFTNAAKQRAYYNKIWKKVKSGNYKFIMKILNNLAVNDGVMNEEETKAYVKTHPNGKIMIEPLFKAKTQKYSDVQEGNYPNFTYYVGTATNISNQVVGMGGDACVNKNTKDPLYKVYCSRSEKGHVSRMANSLRLEKKVLGISTVKAASRGKTTMMDVADTKKGYGVAIAKFSDFGKDDEPGKPSTECYKINRDDSDCDDPNSDTITISSQVDEDDSSSAGETCNPNHEGYGYANSEIGYSQSKYGEYTLPINHFCNLYCNREITYKFPTGKINGLINFENPFGDELNSNFYNDRFAITAEESLDCKIDFTYVYNYSDNNGGGSSSDLDSNVDIVFKKNARGTIAENWLSIWLGSYRATKKDRTKAECEADENCKKYLDGYTTTVHNVKSSIQECANMTIDPKQISKLVAPEITKNGEKIELEEETSESNCVNCEGIGLQYLTDNHDICGGNDGKKCSDHLCSSDKGLTKSYSGACVLAKYYEENLPKREAIHIDTKKVYKLKNNNVLYNFNKDVDQGENSNYKKTISKINDDVAGVCKGNGTSSSSNNETENKELSGNLSTKITMSVPIGGKCSNKNFDLTVNNSPVAIACECPPETYHAGTNAYYWASQQKLNNPSLEADFSSGLTCASARRKVCNNKSLEKFDGGYESILGADESTAIDQCLYEGIPYQVCYERTDRDATCTNTKGEGFDLTNLVYEYIRKNNLNPSSDSDWESARSAVLTKTNCRCGGIPKLDSKKFIYRTIKLGIQNEAFPGLNGKGRIPGSNWNDKDTIETIITNTSDIYNKQPMYKIVLNHDSIVKVRDYNKSHKYDDFNMDCGSNGEGCVSEFLNNEITVEGKCANVNKTASSFYGAGCVNYNAREE